MNTQTNSNDKASVLVTVPADLDDVYQEIDKFVTKMNQFDYASKWGSYDYGLIMKSKYYEGIINSMISEIEKRTGAQDIVSLFRGWVDDMVQAYLDGRNGEYISKIPHPDIGRYTELCTFLMNARQYVDAIYMCVTPLIHLDEIYTGGYPYEPKKWPAGADQESIKKFEAFYEELSKYSEEKPYEYIPHRVVELIVQAVQFISDIQDSIDVFPDDDELSALFYLYAHIDRAMKIIDSIKNRLLHNEFYQALCPHTSASDILPDTDMSNDIMLNTPLRISLDAAILINSTPRLINIHGVIAQAWDCPLPSKIVSEIQFELDDLSSIVDEVFQFIMDEAGIPSDESTLNDMIRNTESLFSDELLIKYGWLISITSHVKHDVIILKELIRRNQPKGEINNDTRKS